MNTLRSN